MRRFFRTLTRSVCASMVLVGIAGLTNLAMELGANSATTPELSPGEVVASRFLSDDDMGSVSQPSAETAATSDDESASLSAVLFSPALIYPTAVANADPAGDNAKTATTGSIDHGAAVADRRSAPIRNNALFNDAQITSIRGRLKLSADQQQYWPPVEAALRAIAWRHKSDASRKTAHRAPGTLDAGEIEGLKSAAMPLIMRLRDDQKNEVRQLARLMGLDSVASQL
jgi:hypothetical protein